MKIPSRKVIVISLSTLMVLATGAIGYATLGTPKPVYQNNSSFAPHLEIKPQQSERTETTATPAETQTATPEPTVSEPVATTTPAPIAAPVATPVRSFDEIIMDYHYLSVTPQVQECARMIQAKFPERFQDYNREANIALLASKFTGICYLVYPEPVGNSKILTQDWWIQNGGQ